MCILWCCIIKKNASKKGFLGLLLLSKKLVRPMFLRGEHTIRLVPTFILNCLRYKCLPKFFPGNVYQSPLLTTPRCDLWTSCQLNFLVSCHFCEYNWLSWDSWRLFELIEPQISPGFVYIWKCIFSLLYISYGTSRKNLPKYQDISSLVVVSFILSTWMFEQAVMM